MICAPKEDSAQSDQSSLCAQWVAKDPSFLHADSEDTDQTGQMPSLIRVFAGCTGHFIGFVVRWLTWTEQVLAWHGSHVSPIMTYRSSNACSYEPFHDKTCLCRCATRYDSTIEATKSPWILYMASIGTLLFRQRRIKVLIRLLRCKGWCCSNMA